MCGRHYVCMRDIHLVLLNASLNCILAWGCYICRLFIAIPIMLLFEISISSFSNAIFHRNALSAYLLSNFFAFKVLVILRAYGILRPLGYIIGSSFRVLTLVSIVTFQSFSTMLGRYYICQHSVAFPIRLCAGFWFPPSSLNAGSGVNSFPPWIL
jgi:hypothetical protein